MGEPENPPAFPRSDAGYSHGEAGMSLRDWFAGQALAGFAASPAAMGKWRDETVAECAYQVADAMLDARKGTSHD